MFQIFSPLISTGNEPAGFRRTIAKTPATLILLSCLLSFFQNETIAQSRKDTVLVMSDSSLSITSGRLSMTVNPAIGGRITSFKLHDYEFLIGKEVHADNYGSTFWPSPQSCWNWPPPPVLDSDPYSVRNDRDSVELVSGKDRLTGLQFVKVVSARKDNGMRLTYSMINTADEIKKAAPWEITRVHKGGLFFFPIGEKPVGEKYFEPVRTDIIDGIVWYEDEKEKPKNNELGIADGSEGWVAYAIDDELFIKKFQDVKPEMQAPAEAEVLFYVSAEANYLEIEIQGKYEAIKPGDRSTWHVEWIAAHVPSNIKVERGSGKLVEFVRELVK